MDENSGIFVVGKKVCVTELKPGDIILDASSAISNFNYDFINRIFSQQTYNNKVKNNDNSGIKIIIKDKKIAFATLDMVYGVSIVNGKARVTVTEKGYSINYTLGYMVDILEYVPFNKLKQKINADVLLNLSNFI